MIAFKVHLTQIDAATMTLSLDAFDGDLFSFGFQILTVNRTQQLYFKIKTSLFEVK